jgi:hypothetical protein
MIDGINKEIRFGVPYGASTLPNVVFKCFYGDGLGSSIQEVPGQDLYVSEGRKWSVDYIDAHSMLRVWRQLPASPNPGVGIDPRIATTQILVASALNDGQVPILNPTSYADYDKLINVRYRTTFATMFAISKLGGVELTARGNGSLRVIAFASRSDQGVQIAEFDLQDSADAFITYCDENGYRWGLLFTNSENDGDWFQLQNVSLYLGQFWAVSQ